jgi:capsular polysaccharide export protein
MSGTERPQVEHEAKAEIDLLRAQIDAANREIRVACGMAWWKKQRIAQFLASENREPLIFTDDARKAMQAADGGLIAVWPSRMPAGLEELAGDRLVRIEDGFIRSVGLGADLHLPLSIVVDRHGIYYDPTRPSDLETILERTAFTPDQRARAKALIETIVTRGISKYAREAPAARPTRRAKRTVLVPGQVEDDMSVMLGGAGVTGNLDLLRRCRAAEPDAHIMFKPHPDVDAGHRRGRVPDSELARYADEIIRGESMPSLLARVDAVHVLTSLTGFEALLRGLDVSVHGHPFFAGWGLTRDLAGPVARRTRRLTLAELVAGALILYPRYLDPVTELPCPPELLIERLVQGWQPKRSWLIRLRQIEGRIARLLGTVSR